MVVLTSSFNVRIERSTSGMCCSGAAVCRRVG